METNITEQLLKKVIEQETGAADVLLSTRLDSLIDDSLEFLSLVLAVENALGFKVPDEKYGEIETVGDLYRFAVNVVPA